VSNDTTACDLCTGSVAEDDVQKCADCERDGLCPKCLDNHDCEGAA
jgi:hypothetical protein